MSSRRSRRTRANLNLWDTPDGPLTALDFVDHVTRCGIQHHRLSAREALALVVIARSSLIDWDTGIVRATDQQLADALRVHVDTVRKSIRPRLSSDDGTGWLRRYGKGSRQGDEVVVSEYRLMWPECPEEQCFTPEDREANSWRKRGNERVPQPGVETRLGDAQQAEESDPQPGAQPGAQTGAQTGVDTRPNQVPGTGYRGGEPSVLVGPGETAPPGDGQPDIRLAPAITHPVAAHVPSAAASPGTQAQPDTDSGLDSRGTSVQAREADSVADYDDDDWMAGNSGQRRERGASA